MIKFENCNNIEKGQINIIKNALNIKYAFNGTGKSTISKALVASINGDSAALSSLKPFKFSDDISITPKVEGLKDFNSVLVFNEDYVNQYVFQTDELIKNSFEIFVRTEKYDEHMDKINQLLKEIHTTFNNDDDLRILINDLKDFLDSFGRSKKGFAKSSILGKALGTSNKLNNIPDDLKDYEQFLTKKGTNVPWLKWQMSGKDYQLDGDVCPYCAKDITAEKTKISKMQESFDTKEIDSLNKIIDIFIKFKKYFTDETNEKIKEISENITGITPEQNHYLNTIREQADVLRTKLENLRNISFITLQENVDDVFNSVTAYKIDLSYISSLNSSFVKGKIEIINKSINSILEKIGEIKGEVKKQKSLIERTISKYDKDINDFLQTAGYNYHVKIEDTNGDYKLKLYHNECNNEISNNKEHLSYGERNAFALALFMYNALNEDVDLVILDDPISSFDGNKKFAIINKLFMGSNSLKDKTVLLLTHEFNIVIDTIYNFKGKIVPTPNAYFLTTVNGELTEKAISKSDIKSFIEILSDKLKSTVDSINKLIYLRRWFELNGDKNLAWNLLSSLFHKSPYPTKYIDGKKIQMTSEDIVEATNYIKKYVKNFDYQTELTKVLDNKYMKSLYLNCNCNYEKLQIFRIIFDDQELNSVIKNFINNTFHVENDYIFQLNPEEYNTVPQYVIDICNKMINGLKVSSGIIE